MFSRIVLIGNITRKKDESLVYINIGNCTQKYLGTDDRLIIKSTKK